MTHYTSTLLPQDEKKEENQKATLDLLAKINAVIDDVNSQISSLQNSIIPVGFVYTQLPGMADPSTMWPFGTWANISSTFAGDFFRAEGGSASAFESGEQLDAFQGHWHRAYSFSSGGANTVLSSVSTGNAVSTEAASQVRAAYTDGVNGTPRTASETRPVNHTVRIWERTA